MPATLSSTKTRSALSTAARISLQVLVLLVMTGVALWLLGKMWSVIWPVVVEEPDPKGARIGAEIRGLDLRADLSEDTVAQIRAALNAHKALVFRNANIRTDAGSLRPAAFSTSRTRVSASFQVTTCWMPSFVLINGLRRR